MVYDEGSLIVIISLSFKGCLLLSPSYFHVAQFKGAGASKHHYFKGEYTADLGSHQTATRGC
jgi:hypothetical protein